MIYPDWDKAENIFSKVIYDVQNYNSNFKISKTGYIYCQCAACSGLSIVTVNGYIICGVKNLKDKIMFTDTDYNLIQVKKDDTIYIQIFTQAPVENSGLNYVFIYFIPFRR